MSAKLSGHAPQYQLNSLNKMPGSLRKVLDTDKKSNLINSFPTESETHHNQHQPMGYHHGGSSSTSRQHYDVSNGMPSHAPEANGSPVGSPIYSMPMKRSINMSTPVNSRPPSPNASAPDVILY